MTYSTITAAQARMARAALGWSQREVAEAAGVAKQTLADFEREARQPYPRTLADIRRMFEAHGVAFTNGDAPGVRLPRSPDSG